MGDWQKGLTINGTYYNFRELLHFSSDQIVSADTEPWEKEIHRFIINWLSDNDFMMLYTSGTTGKPKEIKLMKNSMTISARNTCSLLQLKAGDTALLCMPVEYIAGKMMIVRCFVNDMNLLTTAPRSTPDLSGHPRIDLCAMVPMQVSNLLLCRTDLNPVKKLLIGGAEINHELEASLLKIPSEVFATYGMTETCSHVAIRRLNGPAPQEAFHAMPGVTLSADDRDCLVINAAYLPGAVITNDIIRFTSPGVFTWLGRYDNLINSGGVKIVPEEVESLIMTKTGIECIALGLPDKQFGQKLVLVFEKEKLNRPLSAIKTALDDFLPTRWRPKELLAMDNIPRNESMKTDRRRLLEILSGSPKL